MPKLDIGNSLNSSLEKDKAQQKIIIVNIAKQQLSLLLINTADANQGNQKRGCRQQDQAQYQLIRTFSISTAKNGVGNQKGSHCTPLGKHLVAVKIGTNLPINSVFVARKPTGEIYSEQLASQYPDRDWILTRILRLEGCEEGINKGSNTFGCCDSFQRYIYIHGTPDSESMGVPLSHGCVRMRNTDLIWLYDQVAEGTLVYIVAK